MPSPIVHIGFHKTATSWFQAAIYPHVENHRLVDRDLVRSVFMDGDAFDFDPAAAREALRLDADARPAVICEEELSGVLHIGAASTYIAKEVARRIHAAIPDAQIVIFVREQVDAATSWYLQYLKEGGTASARRYLFPDEYLFPGRLMLFKTARFNFAQLDYSGLIKTYDQLFGRDRVHVFAYEELKADSAGVLARMQEELGLEFKADADVHSARVNRAYRRGLLPIARVMNRFTARQVANKRTLLHLPFWFRARWEILERLNALPLFGGRPRADALIDARTRAWIEDRFAASNAWLAERMGRDLGALGYALERQPSVQPPRRNRWIRWSRM
jgi:hypothetical protein